MLSNEQLTEVVESHEREISDLKEKIKTLAEFGENVVKLFETMQE